MVTPPPPIGLAALPLVIVGSVNLLMSLFVLPRLDFSFRESAGRHHAVGVGRAVVAVKLAAAILTIVVVNAGGYHPARERRSPAPTPRAAGYHGGEPGGVRRGHLRRCPRLRWFANGCCQSAVALGSPPRHQRAGRADRIGLGG